MKLTTLRVLSFTSLWLFAMCAGWFLYRAQSANAGQGVAGEADAKSIWSEDGISDFKLTERSGKEVTKKDLLGKPFVIGFIFTQCAGPCPKVSRAMADLKDRMKDEDVRFVTMTVWPEMDDADRLKDYADVFTEDKENWLFLTGKRDDIYKIIREDYKMPVKEITGPDRRPGWEILHTTNLLLVDSKGVVQGKYNSLNETEQLKLRKAIKALND